MRGRDPNAPHFSAALEPLEQRLLLSVTMTADGWTDVEPSPDSRIVYVSSSEGSDSNNGLSESDPVSSISKGISLLRPGMPDHLLLKRGDVWTNQYLGYWNRQGGRSADEPMLISYYGDSADPRPLLLTGGESGMKADGVNNSGSPDHRRIDYLAIIGLHFEPHTYDGTATDSWGMRPSGIRWMAGTDWVLIEDNMFEGYGGNVSFGDGYGKGVYNVTVRRNVIVDAWASDPDALAGRSQGIYTSNVHNLLIEENFFDHNGWKELYGDTGPDIYSHNMYIQYTNWDVVVRGNISARASSHGMQLRPGGVAEGNMFINDTIAFFLKDGDGDGSDNIAVDNVVLHGSRKTLRPDGWPRGWGIAMSSISGSEAIRNIVAHGEPGCTKALEGLSGVYTEDNVVYDWGYSDPGPFPDPSRTIMSYDALVGGAGTLESFFAGMRQQSRQTWNPDYTAAAAIPYFQVGFGIAPAVVGDFNGDSSVDAADIDLLFDEINAGTHGSAYDLTGDGLVNQDDADELIHNILNTEYGDANLDGTIDAGDLSLLAGNWMMCPNTWAMGDFTGSGCVGAADLSLLAANWQSSSGAAAAGSDATPEAQPDGLALTREDPVVVAAAPAATVDPTDVATGEAEAPAVPESSQPVRRHSRLRQRRAADGASAVESALASVEALQLAALNVLAI